MLPLSPRRALGMELAMMARAWRNYLELALAKDGLTEAGWGPLVHLSRSGDGVQQKVLAARIGIDTSTLVRLIDMLEERQFVSRQIDPADRRGRLLYLTLNGRALVQRIEDTLSRAELEILSDLTDADLQSLQLHLQTIRQRTDALLESAR